MSNKLPILALKDVVLFPGIITPIFIGREKSITAVNIGRQLDQEEHLLFVTQKNSDIEDPKQEDLYKVGVYAKILQVINLPHNQVKLLVEAESKVNIVNLHEEGGTFWAEYEVISDKPISNINKINLLLEGTKKKFSEYVKLNKKINTDVLTFISEQKNPHYVSYIFATHLSGEISRKQELLEIIDIEKRIKAILEIIVHETSLVETEQVIQSRVKKQMEKTQKDYYLNEQMKAIQKELGDNDDKTEITELEKKIKTLKLSKEAKERAESELRKLKMMNPIASEATVVRNYLDVLLSMPWGKHSKTRSDIKKAEEVLNRDHYGLEKVKERIVEHLAVLQRTKKIKGSILCFIGPPGVGKTSLAKSIAEAIGREYTKFSLGGIRDEAEIRGHRKTYLGSMPGKIIQLLKKAKTNDPVMLLDEIDKIGSDFRGDPSSALLEVLDPEQNTKFVDHYLEVEYDLSNILFIATANTFNLPRPLIDRLEIINISGYIEDEKLQIAKNYLIPKQLKNHGMKKSEIHIEDNAVLHIIRYYTRESGVRSLEREIATLLRKALKKILSNAAIKRVVIESEDLEEYLGVKKYRIAMGEDQDMVGMTTGLAYTEVGGELLSIEAVSIPGKGDIKATGKLGEVMKESSQAAFSFFCSRAEHFGVKTEYYKTMDIHLHVPEGAIPKDGPSAGIAIFTTIVSLMTGIPVKRTVAMTGEITLKGRVLPIGGLREKLLAASRGGIKTVIIPKDNEKDLKEIPDSIKKLLKIIPVDTADQVLDIALTKNIR